MEEIIGKLTAEHVKLTQLAAEILAINGVTLGVDAQHAHRVLIQFSATLHNHIALEDKSLYPRCLEHRDLNAIATRFLSSRFAIETSFQRFHDAWSTATKIKANPRAFRSQIKEQLAGLGQRMFEEDESFHPAIVRAFAASPARAR